MHWQEAVDRIRRLMDHALEVRDFMCYHSCAHLMNSILEDADYTLGTKEIIGLQLPQCAKSMSDVIWGGHSRIVLCGDGGRFGTD